MLTEQPALDAEDVEVAADELVRHLGLGVACRLPLVEGFLLLGREVARLELLRPVLVDHRQQPVLQVDDLVVVAAAVLAVEQLQPPGADGGGQLGAPKQLPVEALHQPLGGRDGHRVAHRQHDLDPGLHELAAQARLAGPHLFAALAGVEDGDGHLVQQQQVRQLAGLDQVRPPILAALERQEGLEPLVGRQVAAAVTPLGI